MDAIHPLLIHRDKIANSFECREDRVISSNAIKRCNTYHIPSALMNYPDVIITFLMLYLLNVLKLTAASAYNAKNTFMCKCVRRSATYLM